MAATARDCVHGIEVEAFAPGRYRIAWGADFTTAPVAIFAGDSPSSIALDTPLVAAAVGAAELPPLAPERRHYFHLRRSDGSGLVVAQRNVPLAGGVNFRDLGGYLTSDGRRVHWGRLFRSGHMANLTDDDKRVFAALDVRTICDFRLAEERASEMSRLPNEPRLEILGIAPGINDAFYFHRLFASTTDPQAIVDAMHEMLRSLVRDVAPRYGRLFEVLLEQPAGSTLINCSAGKERTGIGAALVLTALGVPRTGILYDFMLSRRYFPAEAEVPRVRQKYAVEAPGELGRALIMPLLETRESYLQSAFEVIDREYGSGEEFLRRLYGLGPPELRRLRDCYTG